MIFTEILEETELLKDINKFHIESVKINVKSNKINKRYCFTRSNNYLNSMQILHVYIREMFQTNQNMSLPIVQIDISN